MRGFQRPGFALPLALVVIVIGLVLSVFIFDMGSSFLFTMAKQESLYVDHVAVTDYVEAAKGWLVERNISEKQVMHALLRPSPDMPVTSLNDLMLDDPPGTPPGERYLSFDRKIPYQGGETKRVTVNVFDVHYFKEDIAPSLLNDPVQMRFLPPPINSVAGSSVAVKGMSSEGNTTAADLGKADSAGNSLYPWDTYGAYVVRVQLYEMDQNGNQTLRRVTDEAFFQVLSKDKR